MPSPGIAVVQQPLRQWGSRWSRKIPDFTYQGSARSRWCPHHDIPRSNQPPCLPLHSTALNPQGQNSKYISPDPLSTSLSKSTTPKLSNRLQSPRLDRSILKALLPFSAYYLARSAQFSKHQATSLLQLTCFFGWLSCRSQGSRIPSSGTLVQECML